MEVITYHVGVLSRGSGRSAVQYAAYSARTRLQSSFNGLTYDYSRRQDLLYAAILLPPNAPHEFYDRETLWNAVEWKEKHRNARLARTVYFSLPRELPKEVYIDMARIYVQTVFVDQGMCADCAIHDKGDGNPHTHVLLTTRSLDANGEWMPKQHRNYLLDENGNRILDSMTHRYKLGRSIMVNDWDTQANVERWRKGWAEMCNLELERHGIERRVTHLSYARQGMDREPTRHLGARVKALEDRGIRTDRGDENRRIRLRNHERERRHDRYMERQFERDWERSK